MATRESQLWSWLAKSRVILRSRLHINRVENAAAPGTPDVEGYYRGEGRLPVRGQFWIELKSVARPAKIGTVLKIDVRDAQVDWLVRRWGIGGNAWLLIQVGSAHKRALYLLRGDLAPLIGEGVCEPRLREYAHIDVRGPAGPDAAATVIRATIR